VPQPVAFDATTSHDPDGAIVRYDWDFGDGTRADDAGSQVAHTYRQPGRYFPTLTVVDDQGTTDRFIAEVDASAAVPADVWTGPAVDVDTGAATLRGTVNPHNQTTAYRFEYGTTTAYGSSTANEEVAEGRNADLPVEARLTELAPGTYHYRLVTVNALGTVQGEDRLLRVPPDVHDPYRDAVLAADPDAYWRLGEAEGLAARDETGVHPGTYTNGGVRLGEVGALFGELDYAAGFDGLRGEMSATVPMSTATMTIEGWFDWRAGVTLMRDHNSMANQGWILAFNRNGALAWRAAGREFRTSRTVASLQGAWHHLALTMGADGVVTLYVDGQSVQTGPLTVPLPAELRPQMPWHVMRNGNSTSEFTLGRADEIAVYARALSAAEIGQHFAIATTGGG
jgi:YD repeat-containing protein